MKTANISRRSVLALGLSGAAMLALAGCDGGEPADGGSGDGGEEASDAVQIDVEAFDALVSSGPVADDAAIAASEWATKVKNAGVFRVGATQTSQLFSLLNEVDGRMRGFDAGLYQMLAGYILGDPNNYDVTLVQSSTRESVLQSDQVDAVFATYSITPARQEVISFAGPYFTAHQGILVAASNTDINGVEDLDGKTVGVQEGSTGRALLEEYAPGADVQEIGTDEELRRALEQGRIDAYVVDVSLHMGSMVSNPGKYRLAGEFGPDDNYGIGLPLDSDGVAFVNEFLNTVISSGLWTQLWQICIGDRTGITDVPEPPVPGV